jgi:hypothetical protein
MIGTFLLQLLHCHDQSFGKVDSMGIEDAIIYKIRCKKGQRKAVGCTQPVTQRLGVSEQGK